MAKVGYMGIPGSFSEIAAEKLLERNNMTEAELVPLVCAENILKHLQDRSIAYGVLGITNSTAGPVAEFVDTFSEIAYEKIDEYVLPIHHCLFKKPQMALEDLKEVASHPQALSQTKGTRAAKYAFLKDHEIEDTAIGAEWLAKGELPETTAVICSIQAGKSWNLDLIEQNIEDSDENRTTFWLLKL